jgi:hypothetical protein
MHHPNPGQSAGQLMKVVDDILTGDVSVGVK